MQERMIQRKHIAFVAGAFDGKNRSGYQPIGDSVCVMVDTVDGKLGTKGLITMTPGAIEMQNQGATSGVIVEVGPDAFVWSADRKRPFGDDRPKVGDRVFFVRYAGEATLGVDQKMYRIMSDNSIVAIFKEKSNGL
jgi:co-chaperonin GroES (HSP10)